MAEATILICAYNAERYLGDAIDSALAQKGVDCEVVVVDDGSTDGTAQVVRTYAERHGERVRLVEIPHKGLSAARNAGFDAARGEWITIFDADDLMHPYRTYAEIQGLKRFPKAAFCFSNRWSFEDSSDEGAVQFDPSRLTGSSEHCLFELEDPLTARMSIGMPTGTSACSSRTEFLRTEARYDEQQMCVVDCEQWMRVMMNRSAVFCTLPLYYRRFHSASMGSSRRDHLDMFHRAVTKAKEHWPDYSPAQQQAIIRYQSGLVLGRARRMIKRGQCREARKILAEYRSILPARARLTWWAFSLLPGATKLGNMKTQATKASFEKIKREQIDKIDVFKELGIPKPDDMS